MKIPRLRLEPRFDEMETLERALRTAIGILLALAAGALLLWVSGYDPAVAYQALFRGSFGSLRAASATLNKSVPIALCAYGIALAYRANLWNVGAEGQLYFGAFAAAGVGLHLPGDTPSHIAMPLYFAAAMAGGGVWAGIAGMLRAHLGMNEILSTLMLTYVAILWVDYLVIGPWVDPLAFSFPFSPPVIEGVRLGTLWNAVHYGLLFSLSGAVFLHLVDRGSRWGYELRVTGSSRRAARYGGIRETRITVAALVAAGMAAGLAGAVEVSASTSRLQSGLSPGYGFMAILVAWLANGRAFGILIASVFYAGLLNGGFALQVSKIPPAIGTILQAGLLIAVLSVVGLASYRLRPVREGAP